MKIGILGLGAIAGQMAGAIKVVPQAEAYACASRDISKAEAFREKHGFSRAYGSYEELLEDPQVELIYIAVPHAFHSELAIQCLNAGKNVLLEKPFAATADQAKQVIELARSKALFAGEGMWMHYLPMCGTLKKLVQEEAVGPVRMLTGSIGYHLTQERLYDPAMAGGALLDVGCYCIAFAGMIFGYDVKKILSAAILTEMQVDACGSVILQYEDDRIANFSISMNTCSDCTGVLWGEQGSIRIDTMNNLANVDILDANRKVVGHVDREPWQNSYEYELKSAIASIEAGRPDTPECPHEEIIKRMEIMDELRRQWGVRYPFE